MIIPTPVGVLFKGKKEVQPHLKLFNKSSV